MLSFKNYFYKLNENFNHNVLFRALSTSEAVKWLLERKCEMQYHEGYKENNLKKYPTIPAETYCCCFMRHYNEPMASIFVEQYSNKILIQFNRDLLKSDAAKVKAYFEPVDANYESEFYYENIFGTRRNENEDRLYSPVSSFKISPKTIDCIYLPETTLIFYCKKFHSKNKNIYKDKWNAFDDIISENDVFNEITIILECCLKNKIPVFYLRDGIWNNYELQNAKRVSIKDLLEGDAIVRKTLFRSDSSKHNKTKFNGKLI